MTEVLKKIPYLLVLKIVHQCRKLMAFMLAKSASINKQWRVEHPVRDTVPTERTFRTLYINHT